MTKEDLEDVIKELQSDKDCFKQLAEDNRNNANFYHSVKDKSMADWAEGKAAAYSLCENHIGMTIELFKRRLEGIQ